MFTSSKEYLNLYFENEQDKKRKANLLESNVNDEIQQEKEDAEGIYEAHLRNGNRTVKAAKIRSDVKKALLSEAIYSVYRESINVSDNGGTTENIMKSIVNNFIEEHGVDKLLASFKSRSYLLSEMSRIIDKYTGIICEKANCEDIDKFSIDPEDKQNFFDELDIEDTESAAQMIKVRVADAIDNFLSDNANSKAEIKEIIQQSQEKIQGTKSEELKESYDLMAKRRISNIRDKKTKSVFESMVFNLTKAVVLNEDLKKIYFKNNKLDMDKIVESVSLMYTFLETVNTCKIIDINEAYIDSILKDMK